MYPCFNFGNVKHLVFSEWLHLFSLSGMVAIMEICWIRNSKKWFQQIGFVSDKSSLKYMPSTKALSRIYPCKHIDHFIDMYWFTYTSRYRLQGWAHQNIRVKSRFHNRFYYLRVCFMVTTTPEIAFHTHLDQIFIFENEIPRFYIAKALVAPIYLAEPRHSYMDIHMITHSALFEKSVVTTLIKSFFLSVWYIITGTSV